ncbi:MAG TPA: hypothetical protein VNA30_05640 [Mycobacteriales bacterium]|nr:hypothetical protein [Mycobacteriales bacterium]
MSASRTRSGLALAAAAAVLLAGSAAAAPPAKQAPVVITDIPSDANMINSQILVASPNNGVATPVGSQPGFDIVSVTFANTLLTTVTGKGKKKKTVTECTGFTMAMKLSGPPADSGRFRMSADTPTNTNFYIIEYDSGQKTSEIRYGGAGQDEVHTLGTPVKVVGDTILFTITAKDMKAIGDKPGDLITAMNATTTYSAQGLLYFPIFDKAPGGEASFKMCG